MYPVHVDVNILKLKYKVSQIDVYSTKYEASTCDSQVSEGCVTSRDRVIYSRLGIGAW